MILWLEVQRNYILEVQCHGKCILKINMSVLLSLKIRNQLGNMSCALSVPHAILWLCLLSFEINSSIVSSHAYKYLIAIVLSWEDKRNYQLDILSVSFFICVVKRNGKTWCGKTWYHIRDACGVHCNPLFDVGNAW